MPPEGFEPSPLDPKSSTLSIKLRGRNSLKNNSRLALIISEIWKKTTNYDKFNNNQPKETRSPPAHSP